MHIGTRWLLLLKVLFFFFVQQLVLTVGYCLPLSDLDEDAKRGSCLADRSWTAVKSCFRVEVHLPLLSCLSTSMTEL